MAFKRFNRKNQPLPCYADNLKSLLISSLIRIITLINLNLLPPCKGIKNTIVKYFLYIISNNIEYKLYIYCNQF